MLFLLGLLFTLVLYVAAVVVGGFLLGFAFRKGWDAAGRWPPGPPS